MNPSHVFQFYLNIFYQSIIIPSYLEKVADCLKNPSDDLKNEDNRGMQSYHRRKS